MRRRRSPGWLLCDTLIKHQPVKGEILIPDSLSGKDPTSRGFMWVP